MNFLVETVWGMGRRSEILRALALFLLIPFLCSTLVPPGTMPARDAQGRVTVILCGDDLPVQMVLAADGSLTPAQAPGEGPDLAIQPCLWSHHAQPILSPDDAPLPAPRVARTLDLPSLPATLPVVVRPPAPVARGPPAFV